MSTTTPYELRFKVLEMARDLCMDEFNMKSHAFHDLQSRLEEKLDGPIGENTALVIRDMIDDLVEATPSMPKTEQINAKAKELYEFVSTK